MQVVKTYTLGLARRVGQDTTLQAPQAETSLCGVEYSKELPYSEGRFYHVRVQAHTIRYADT